MKTLVRNYDSLFNEIFNTPAITPSANISESENGFEIELAIPGFSKDDFKIEVQDRLLTISSKKESATEEKKYLRKEFTSISFQRSFRLPKTVDAENITAQYDNGILVLTLPKLEEAKPKEPRLIAIQ
jgi:HSP20 family protein